MMMIMVNKRTPSIKMIVVIGDDDNKVIKAMRQLNDEATGHVTSFRDWQIPEEAFSGWLWRGAGGGGFLSPLSSKWLLPAIFSLSLTLNAIIVIISVIIITATVVIINVVLILVLMLLFKFLLFMILLIVSNVNTITTTISTKNK